MKGIIRIVIALVLGLALVGLTAKPGTAAKRIPFPDVPRITKKELKPLVGKPDVIILDVRLLSQWKRAELKIPGAIYEDPRKVDSWFEKYPKDKTLVFY
ncbi:hypothetical protein N9174_03270 [bacterium]|nr:hypothetical protein [bacterium]